MVPPPRPLFASTAELLTYTAACPVCGQDAEWDLMLISGRRERQIGCTTCDMQVAWNPDTGTEVVPR